jgi:hypothetical protein
MDGVALAEAGERSNRWLFITAATVAVGVQLVVVQLVHGDLLIHCDSVARALTSIHEYVYD